MKLGMTVGMRGNDPRAFAQYARRLEDAWVEYLWTGEAYNADAVSTMGFLAAVTERAPIEAYRAAGVSVFSVQPIGTAGHLRRGAVRVFSHLSGG